MLGGTVTITAAGNDQINYNLDVQVTLDDGSTRSFCWAQQSCGLTGTSCVNCQCNTTVTACPLPGPYRFFSDQPCSNCTTCSAPVAVQG